MSRFKITDEDRGPIINIATWIMMVAMALAVFTKVASNMGMAPLASKDNLLMLSTMILAICQGVAVTEQVSSGLGKRHKTLSDDQIEGYQKAAYASEFLYIAALCFTKATTIQIIRTLAYSKLPRTIISASIFLVLWGASCCLVVAFQCKLPYAWASLTGQCINQPVFWSIFAAVDILWDLLLAVLPILVLRDLQVAWSKKLPLMAAFGVRILVIPLTILRVMYIFSGANSSDKTHDATNSVLLTQIGLNTGIILACVPFLRNFMEQIHSTVYTPEVHRAVPQHGLFATDLRSASKSSTSRSTTKSDGRRLSRWYELEDRRLGTISSVIPHTAPSRRSSGSQEMIIKQTRSFTVVSEEAAARDSRSA